MDDDIPLHTLKIQRRLKKGQVVESILSSPDEGKSGVLRPAMIPLLVGLNLSACL